MKKVKNIEEGYQFRCSQAVKFVETDFSISEYDEWDRLVFHLQKSSGYWSMRVFAPVVEGERVGVYPLQIIHKYWHECNSLV